MTGIDPEPSPAPRILNKSSRPPGVLPRNIQAWVIGGISLVMVIVIAISGGREPKKPSGTDRAPVVDTVEANQARIQEYRARIEQQARKLAAEQAQLSQTKQALGLESEPTDPLPAASAPATPPAVPSYRSRKPQKSWIELETEKREFHSLFASNVALTYREQAPPIHAAAASGFLGSAAADSATFPVDDRFAQRGTKTQTGAAAGEQARTARLQRDASLNRATGKQYRLFEGTVIETVLTNRLDGSFSGPVNAMVTTNVYSHDRRRLLIPQGSRVLGAVERVETFGQQRLAVMFHRLIMPDGYSVSLEQFQGLNQIGETGLRDKVNRHYFQIFGVSAAIGAIAGLGQANTRFGSDASATDVYRQGVASSLSQSSLRILDRYLNVLPTFTIREGHRVKIHLSDDLLVPAYEKHEMPGDL